MAILGSYIRLKLGVLYMKQPCNSIIINLLSIILVVEAAYINKYHVVAVTLKIWHTDLCKCLPRLAHKV